MCELPLSGAPRGAALFFAGLLLAGCANTRLAREPRLAQPPQQAAAASAPLLPVILYTRQTRFDRPTDGFFGPRFWRRSATKQLGRVLSEFPSLRSAQSETAADVESPRLVIEATHATGGKKGWSKVSSMTKYIVPSREESTVDLEARLMTGEMIVKTFEAGGTYETKKQLLFLLAPWMWKLGVPGEVTAAAFRELLAQVPADAALAPSATATATVQVFAPVPAQEEERPGEASQVQPEAQP